MSYDLSEFFRAFGKYERGIHAGIAPSLSVFFGMLRKQLREDERAKMIAYSLVEFLKAFEKHWLDVGKVAPAFAVFFRDLAHHAAVGRSIVRFFSAGSVLVRARVSRPRAIARNLGKALAEVGKYAGKIARLRKHTEDVQRKAYIAARGALWKNPPRMVIPRTEIACF